MFYIAKLLLEALNHNLLKAFIFHASSALRTVIDAHIVRLLNALMNTAFDFHVYLNFCM
uniref:Uncharacterized protein n=1 Tax=Arundo donax TaxID=35708 RepID=A0A0A9HXQ4_ARUDO